MCNFVIYKMEHFLYNFYYLHADGLVRKICWHRRRMILNYLLLYTTFKLVEKISLA